MKFSGNTEEVCWNIINRFKRGDIPQKLSSIFVNRTDNIPSNSWSWTNQLIMLIQGTNDARTFKQWNSVGRKIIKGSRSFTILGPILKTIPKEIENKETGEKEEKLIKILIGFKPILVFRIEDTEIYNQDLWEKKSGVDHEEKERLENLPLREVAEKWGLKISSYNGKKGGALGYYQHGQRIAIGVKNLSVWCHELIHAADDKNGTLNEIFGQDAENEVVAEFGSSVLLQILGFHDESDIGGTWEYIKQYSMDDNFERDEKKTIKICMKLIDRVCNCINTILEESDEIINNPDNKAA